ncbi:MAG: hypothetical protein H7Z37_11350 [Pyrinomonadaceae bacterium]|nr:hypothetical protein [Pyrinomonadaceae bacterium]
MNETTDENFEKIVQLMIFWSEQWQAHILEHGTPLDERQTVYAQHVGVTAPEKVRVLKVPNVPMPHYEILQKAFIENNVFSLDANGLTLEYGIFIKQGVFPVEYWLTHELVHVAQCERIGGLSPSMRQYLKECLTDGYGESVLEKEAHETALKCLEQHNSFVFKLISNNAINSADSDK